MFLALLVVALVSVNFILYSKLQFKDRFDEEKRFIKLKVRKRRGVGNLNPTFDFQACLGASRH